MKTALMTIAMMTVALALYAQQPSPKSSAAGPAPDAAFVTKIGQVGLAEVELGMLASQKAERDEVKKFAQRMVADHTKAGDELKAIATAKNITWPTELDAEHKALKDKLSKQSGAAFDRAYMQAMVDGHRKVATDFKKETQSGKDTEVKAWASKTLPTIEAHLKDAEMISRGSHSTSTTH
jgi:putative membrane protein